MKQTIIYAAMFFGFVGLVTGLAFWSQQKQPSGDSAKVLASETNSSVATQHYEFDFGTIKMTDGSVKHTFQLKNEGDEDLTISKIATSCDCTSATLVKKDGSRSQKFGMEGMGGGSNLLSEIIKTGEEFDIEVEFNPAAHGHGGVGMVKRLVYIETNSKVKPKTELSIAANVTM